MKGKSIGKNDQNKKLISFPTLKEYIKKSIQKKYKISELVYGTVVIKNILFNEKTHIVAIFKDYLIADDLSEFLKRYYTKSESLVRLPRFFEYYETYSKIYPNYTALRESKYIYKNIHKKQKMIDLQQKIEESEEKKRIKNKNNKHKRNKEKDDLVFSTDIYNSIVNDSEDLYSLLFGINKKNNKNSENTIEDFNQLIKEINKYELEIPNSENDSFLLEQFAPREKNLIKNINKNIAGKLFSTCTKKISISKYGNSSGSYRNYKSFFNEIHLINSSISISHKKTISSSINNSINKKKNKSKSNNKNNNQSYNNILPYSYLNPKKGEIKDLINKIKVNINLNNFTSRKSSVGDKSNNKNNVNIIKNNVNHNRNHNCLLNSKGILISHNSNSINKTQSLKNKNNKKNNISNEKKDKNYKGIFSPKINEKNKVEKIEKKKTKSNNLNLIRKTEISNNNSRTNSISNNKFKIIINNNTNNIVTSSTINTSCQNSNPINKIKYKNNDNKNYYSHERNQKMINVNTINNSTSRRKKYKSGINTKSSSPIQKKIIQGIQIKNFSKALKLSETISPKCESCNKEKNKNKINKQKNSTPKTVRIILKKKI